MCERIYICIGLSEPWFWCLTRHFFICYEALQPIHLAIHLAFLSPFKTTGNSGNSPVQKHIYRVPITSLASSTKSRTNWCAMKLQHGNLDLPVPTDYLFKHIVQSVLQNSHRCGSAVPLGSFGKPWHSANVAVCVAVWVCV